MTKALEEKFASLYRWYWKWHFLALKVGFGVPSKLSLLSSTVSALYSKTSVWTEPLLSTPEDKPICLSPNPEGAKAFVSADWNIMQHRKWKGGRWCISCHRLCVWVCVEVERGGGNSAGLDAPPQMFICSDSKVCSLCVPIYHTALIVRMWPDPAERTQSPLRHICMSKLRDSVNIQTQSISLDQ